MKRLFAMLALVLATGCIAMKPSGDVKQFTSTTFGLLLGQNQSTQAYELKMGLIRDQLTVIPTGREVLKSNETAGVASDVPQVTSRTQATIKNIFFGNQTVTTTLSTGEKAVGTGIGGDLEAQGAAAAPSTPPVMPASTPKAAPAAALVTPATPTTP